MKTESKYFILRFSSIFLIITIFFDFSIYFYSGIDKLVHFDQFIINFGRSPFAPTNFLSESGAIIVIIEIGLSILLFIKRARKITLFVLACLSLIFTIYILLMITYSPSLPCSCGGIVSFLNWNEHLVLTIYLTASSFYAAFIPQNH
jgi:putative oxidoreductase